MKNYDYYSLAPGYKATGYRIKDAEAQNGLQKIIANRLALYWHSNINSLGSITT